MIFHRVQHQNAVLRHDADDHDHSHQRYNIESRACDEQRRQRTRQGEHGAGDDGNRMYERSKLDQQNEENQRCGEGESQGQLAETGLLFLIQPAEFECHAGGKADVLRELRPNRTDRGTEINAFEPRGHGDRLTQPVAMHFRLPRVIFDRRNLIETHESVCRRRPNTERPQSIERCPIAGRQEHAHVERAVALDDRRRCGTAEGRLDCGCDIGGRYSEYRRALRIDAECHRGTADHNPVEDFDDAFHFADRRRDLAGGPMQGGCVFAIQPNLDRGGRALQVADQIAEDPDELYAQPRLGRFDFLPQLAGHFIAWTPALIAQLDGEVAGIWLRYAGEPELQPGAARETLDVGRLLQEAF